ncbi:hypothetical protein HMPREF9946_00231 [Acetobacteraceae bacterium AT-5844]|nr:hypothetical protein HMPREF9946_00231 [Acetobacteraceae bacterium AT-5844]
MGAVSGSPFCGGVASGATSSKKFQKETGVFLLPCWTPLVERVQAAGRHA